MLAVIRFSFIIINRCFFSLLSWINIDSFVVRKSNERVNQNTPNRVFIRFACFSPSAKWIWWRKYVYGDILRSNTREVLYVLWAKTIQNGIRNVNWTIFFRSESEISRHHSKHFFDSIQTFIYVYVQKKGYELYVKLSLKVWTKMPYLLKNAPKFGVWVTLRLLCKCFSVFKIFPPKVNTKLFLLSAIWRCWRYFEQKVPCA